MEHTDAQLVTAGKAGDESAFAELVRRHLGAVFGFVCRMIGDGDDAQDLAQEAFIRAWRSLEKFDTAKNFRPWIFTIAKNAALDFLKKKKNVPFSTFDLDDGSNPIEDSIADTAPLPPELLDRADTGRLLLAALDRLAPEGRAVVILRYNDHLTFEEIAEAMDEPMNTVKSRHRRALAKLREMLDAAPLHEREKLHQNASYTRMLQ